MWCLEVVYNCQYLHALCFTQMHIRSDHRRDLSAALRCHIIQFTILDSIVTVQNVLSGLGTLFGHPGVKCIRRHCKSDIVDAFTYPYCSMMESLFVRLGDLYMISGWPSMVLQFSKSSRPPQVSLCL